MTLDRLKSIIQKANPEIMKLKFGCEVIDTRLSVRNAPTIFLNQTRDRKGNVQAYVHSGKTAWYVPNSIKDRSLEILGRPIRLADVLLTIQTQEADCEFLMHNSSYANTISLKLPNNPRPVSWNLKDDNLDNQSEETKQFLISLLAQ
jgi:hypothetical protein